MHRIVLLKRLLAILCVLSLCGGYWWWLSRYEESAAVTIMASYDNPELGLPVYAQFITTQSLMLPYLASVVRIEVPMYVPDVSLPFYVRLLNREKELVVWSLSDFATDSGLRVVALPFEQPFLLDSFLEVQFDGSEIPYDKKDTAPRVFVETSNGAYVDGHYRIAENNKEGDIAMRFIQRKRIWDRVWEQWKTEPVQAFSEISLFILFALLAGILPYVLLASIGASDD